VDILSTDSNELGNTTRHFILYGEFIFKLTFYKLGLIFRPSVSICGLLCMGAYY
jgi:hypothetical protein